MAKLPKLNPFTIDQAFGGRSKADKDLFADGGSFDQIYLKKLFLLSHISKTGPFC